MSRPLRHWLGILGLALGLAACHHDEAQPIATAPSLPKDEILLPPDSSKRGYIQEQTVEPVAAPIMEPVAGRIGYDETRTARISSPIAGRVISKLPELGTLVKAGAPLVELDSPELGQAQADYANAVSDLRLAEAAYRRARELFEGKVLPSRTSSRRKTTGGGRRTRPSGP